MSAQPWLKFFPADWRADPALRMCSLAARGLWIEMLAIMHEASPRGHLLINGRKVEDRQLAALVGCMADEVGPLVAELEAAGVFSRKKNTVIFSRRMEKDENRAKKLRENGRMGGNPTLRKQTENDGLLIQGDNTQKPEARSQTKEAIASSENASAGEGAEQASDDVAKPDKADKSETARRAANDDRCSAEFEVWYSGYPHRVGKPQARKAYLAARERGATAGDLANGVFRYVAAKPPDQNWCNPATWLNGDRWLDEPGAVAARGASPSKLKSVGHRLADAMGRVARGEQPFASEFETGTVVDAIANR